MTAKLTVKIFIFLAATIVGANPVTAETNNKNLWAGADVRAVCHIVEDSNSRKRTLLQDLLQSEANFLGCMSTFPNCINRKTYETEIASSKRLIALETAKLRLIDTQNITVNVDLSDPEMYVFGAGSLPSGLTKPNTVIYSSNYFGEEIKYLFSPSEVRGTIVREVVPDVRFEYSRHRVQVDGRTSSICALSSNSERRLFSTTIDSVNTTLAGIDFKDVKFQYNVFLNQDLPNDAYPTFDWSILAQPILDIIFGNLVPSSTTLKGLVSCSDEEENNFVKLARETRLAMRKADLIGSSERIFEKSKVEFISIKNGQLSTWGNRMSDKFLKLVLPVEQKMYGLLLSSSQTKNLSISGFFDGSRTTVCNQ